MTELTKTQAANLAAKAHVGKTFDVNGRKHRVLEVIGDRTRYGVKVEDLVRGGEFFMEATSVNASFEG